MKIIYGLGNPGRKYLFSRHNIGFMVVDLLALKWKISVKKLSHDVIYGKGSIAGAEVMLIKPQTYMNLSGVPLNPLKIRSDNLIVVHDDMDIPFGSIRIKDGGGTGGHKGLKSIVEHLGTNSFVRIRCGIGRPDPECDPTDYVLSRFESNQMDELREEIAFASEAIECFLEHGLTKAMNAYNKRNTDNESLNP
jgi:PTH1 family peptidyl-tRNA hydrolase